MAGSTSGGLKSAKKIKKLYGEDFFKVIGSKGGKVGTTGGFYHSKAMGLTWHVEAGRKGGSVSRRGKQWVPDDGKPFSEGFNQPTWADKIKSKLRRI